MCSFLLHRCNTQRSLPTLMHRAGKDRRTNMRFALRHIRVRTFPIVVYYRGAAVRVCHVHVVNHIFN